MLSYSGITRDVIPENVRVDEFGDVIVCLLPPCDIAGLVHPQLANGTDEAAKAYAVAPLLPLLGR